MSSRTEWRECQPKVPIAWAKLQKLVKDQGFLIDGGYGKIKGTTFRISNMGDETEATMGQLYAALDSGMKQF